MSDTVDALILDLLEWVGPEPRPYAEVLEAWRTSCPRLPVWEDANDRGFVSRRLFTDKATTEPRFRSVEVAASQCAHPIRNKWPAWSP